jgi:death on curing protein
MTQYVTTADALFFHKVLIERYGGATGIRDAGALESALHRPQTGYYDTIVHEAAALLESLVQNHPFVDGNKRVAFAAVDVSLRINGHALKADSKAIYDSLLEFLNNGTFDMEHLVPWLQAIIVADRGEVVAEFSPPGRGLTDGSVPPGLLSLARRGLLTLGSPGDASVYAALPRVHRGQRSAAELLDEQRGSR